MTTITTNMAPTLAPIYVRLTVTALLWAGTFIAGRLLSGSLSPLPAATGRFGVAVVLLLFLSWKMEGGLPRLNVRQAITTILLGLTGVFLYNILFFSALSEMPASRTALFVAFNPIVVALLFAGLHRENLSASKWAGIAIALCGALIVISRGDLPGVLRDVSSAFGKGEMFMLSAVLSWAVYTILGRRVLTDISPLAATTYAAIWGFAGLVVALALNPPADIGSSLTLQNGLTVLYLAVGGTVIPFVWYYQGVQSIGPARTAIFTNLVPVFGVFLGVALLGEPLMVSMLLGGALVVLGVTLTSRR